MFQQQSADWVRLVQSPSRTGNASKPSSAATATNRTGHDTYAIGQTIAGVQSFHYRGGRQHSLPGGTIVLHPDEIHRWRGGHRGGGSLPHGLYRTGADPEDTRRQATAVYSRRPVGGSAPAVRRAAVIKSGHGHLRAAGGRGRPVRPGADPAVVGGQRSRRQAFDYQAAERGSGVYPCLFYAGSDPRHPVAGQRPGPLEP